MRCRSKNRTVATTDFLKTSGSFAVKRVCVPESSVQFVHRRATRQAQTICVAANKNSDFTLTKPTASIQVFFHACISCFTCKNVQFHSISTSATERIITKSDGWRMLCAAKLSSSGQLQPYGERRAQTDLLPPRSIIVTACQLPCIQ
jgi:hypothetical protein